MHESARLFEETCISILVLVYISPTDHRGPKIYKQKQCWFITHRIHVWYIYCTYMYNKNQPSNISPMDPMGKVIASKILQVPWMFSALALAGPCWCSKPVCSKDTFAFVDAVFAFFFGGSDSTWDLGTSQSRWIKRNTCDITIFKKWYIYIYMKLRANICTYNIHIYL